MKAYTDKSKVIDTIGDRVGGESRPPLFASSSSRRQHLPAPPRQEMRGTNGSSYFGCARYGIRMIERSRRTMQSPQYAPNDSTRVGADRSVGRGRVLSQSLLVARERRRRELGSNLVIVTTTLTSGEGHVVEIGVSQRVRKILAGVPASVSFRDHILALSLSREAKRQHWTVGNRPIRKNDLRSLHRNSVEAQIQDRSRQKTGLNTAPGFSRVYPSFPRTREPRGKQSTPHQPPLRGAKGTRAQHAGDARNSPPPTIPADHPVIPADHPVIPADHPVIPADHPVIPADHPVIPATPSFPRTREPRVKQSTPFPSPFALRKGTRAQRAGVCPKTTKTPTTAEAPPPTTTIPLHHRSTPSATNNVSPLPRAITPPPPRGRLRGGHG